MELIRNGRGSLEKGAPSLLREYYEFHKKKDTNNDVIWDAYNIFTDPFQREIIEALLLSDAPLAEIEIHFGISPKTIEAYKFLFFDTSIFKSHLAKLSYVEQYNESKFGRDVKLRALNLGPDFIFFRYANINPTSEKQRLIVKKLFMSSAFRAMEANYSDINSNTSKQAMEWGRLMLKAYEAIEKLMAENSDTSNNVLKIIFSNDSQSNLTNLNNPALENLEIV